MPISFFFIFPPPRSDVYTAFQWLAYSCLSINIHNIYIPRYEEISRSSWPRASARFYLPSLNQKSFPERAIKIFFSYFTEICCCFFFWKRNLLLHAIKKNFTKISIIPYLGFQQEHTISSFFRQFFGQDSQGLQFAVNKTLFV